MNLEILHNLKCNIRAKGLLDLRSSLGILLATVNNRVLFKGTCFILIEVSI